MTKFTLCACCLLTMSLLLGGCQARYGIKSHRAVRAEGAESVQYPTVTMETGDVIRAVTPAKGLMFGGYWLGVYVAQAEVARHLPREGSFFTGTDIEAVGLGRTQAYYLNAVNLLPAEPLEPEALEEADWFWIEVVQPQQ